MRHLDRELGVRNMLDSDSTPAFWDQARRIRGIFVFDVSDEMT